MVSPFTAVTGGYYEILGGLYIVDGVGVIGIREVRLGIYN